MASSVGNKTGNKMALLYGLFNWQQNGFIIWLIQLTTKRATIQLSIVLIQLATKLPYCMAYSIGNKMALLYGLFNLQQNGQQNGLNIWLIQLATKRAAKRPYYMAYSIGNKTGNKTALIYGLFN